MRLPRFLAVLSLASTSVLGQPLPREFPLTPERLEVAPDYLTQLPVPNATCAAVCDRLALVAVGHQSRDGSQLSIFPLDAAGKPGSDPLRLSLPKPEALSAHANYPLGLLFHPRLPLLYVWQDIDSLPKDQQNEKNPAFEPWLEFDHLLIYAVNGQALELVHSGARGAGFHVAQNGGTVGLDFETKHLFVPNTRGETPEEGGLACFALDANGLPENDLEQATGKRTPGGGKAPVETNPTDKKARRITPKKDVSCRNVPTGLGWHAGREAMIMGGHMGCLMADFHDGTLRRAWFDTNELATLGWASIAGHPEKPVLYMCLGGSRFAYSIGQVNGWISLLPQKATLAGNVHLQGPPVVLQMQGKVAFGDTKSIHLFGLAADGRFDGTCIQIPLPAGVIHGMAYSDKYGRLYVAVDSQN